jgi:hypothetical protein
MSDIDESPQVDEVIDASLPVPLGGQPFVSNVQSEAEHGAQRVVAQETAKIALQKVLEIAQQELANLPYSPGSKALGSTRSHLAHVIGHLSYSIDNLPR